MNKLNIFRSFRLTWYQNGLYKLCIASGGIAIGALWPEVFAPYVSHLFTIFVIIGAYLMYVWWNQ